MERTLALISDAHSIVESHLSADDMAAMIDGRLPANRRDAVETHLADCYECRSELAAASVVVDSVPARARVSRWWISGAAAAALILAAVPVLQRVRTDSSAASERADGASSASIIAIAPTTGMRVATDSVVFTWRAVPGVATYQLFVTDSVGSPVYRLNTTDTTVAPSNEAQLRDGSRYYWYVDALRADGSSITSTPISFSINAR